MGRRRQGQDRRLAVRARRYRRALPGRPQCRPHARHRRRQLQAEPAAVRRGAARQAVGHRQRRRRRSVGASSTRSSGCKAQGVAVTPDNLRPRRECRADPAAAPRARRSPRERRTAARRSAPPSAASARPTRTRSAAAPSASSTSPTRRRLPAKIDRLLAHHNALRRGLGADGDRRARRCSRQLTRRSRRRSCPSPARPGGSSTRRGATASASCSRARRARSSTSTTAPIPSSPRPTPSPARRRPARASARGAIDYVLGITKAYTTRVGEGPFPTEDKGEIGRVPRPPRPRVRHRHRAQAPLRLVRRRARPPDGRRPPASTASR